jgi:chromosome segregation ATPase
MLLGESRNTLGSLKARLSKSHRAQGSGLRELHGLQSRLEEFQDAIVYVKSTGPRLMRENRNLLQSREVLLGRIEKEEKHYHALVEREKHLEAQIAFL